MQNKLQNQGSRLTVKAFSGSAWERIPNPLRGWLLSPTLQGGATQTKTACAVYENKSGFGIKPAKKTKQVSFVCLFLLSAVYCLLTQAGVQAQRSQNIQNITVSPGFSPTPIRVQGVGGGSVSISQIAGRQETANGPCVGFTDAKPNHNLVLNSAFNYLSIQVESREDTTLLVRGPGGIWCNDDFRGKNPGLAGQWLPGTYEIWVGSYGKEKQAPYTLRISEQR
ncbi:hypothetical protein [Microseira sp. BLCC-F43]|jgi:hypothetical protein|uniref:hypothetical protein n=1 Tax=Microseira sp. BLCC-F43 TaxID=3153602 RepID=UPI0035B9C892